MSSGFTNIRHNEACVDLYLFLTKRTSFSLQEQLNVIHGHKLDDSDM
jgi:hypothetical protein